MNSPRPIGGYFELELRHGTFPYADAVLLNSARNCFEYILRASTISRVYLPKYICDVMLEPLERAGVDYTLYAVDQRLEIAEEIKLAPGELILYVNYFGLKDEYCRALGAQYGESLIVDASQAFYFEPLNLGSTLYSPRKFFGLPDGGCLITKSLLAEDLPQAHSIDRMSHLLKRIEAGAEAGYKDFQINDQRLSAEPLQSMSEFTRRLLDTIDFEQAKTTRQSNYRLLKEKLANSNQAQFDDSRAGCPMYYPYVSKDASLRERLIREKIFVPTYWPNVLSWCHEDELEYQLATNIIPLPIDQRYGRPDMLRIIDIIERGAA